MHCNTKISTKTAEQWAAFGSTQTPQMHGAMAFVLIPIHPSLTPSSSSPTIHTPPRPGLCLPACPPPPPCPCAIISHRHPLHARRLQRVRPAVVAEFVRPEQGELDSDQTNGVRRTAGTPRRVRTVAGRHVVCYLCVLLSYDTRTTPYFR